MSPSWLKVAIGAIGLLSVGDVASAIQPGLRHPAGPGYRGRDACPARCSISGPNPANWSAYHNLDQIQSCSQTVFYEFSLYDGVDDPKTLHRIYACTSYGADWTNLPNKTATTAHAAKPMNATYEIGWWSDGVLAASDIRALSRQMRRYLANGYGATNRTVLLFARSGQGSVGLYIGKGLQNEGTSRFALKTLEDNIPFLGVSTASLAMQLCEPGYDSDHIFGFMATSNTTFAPVQDALTSWSKAKCLSFEGARNITGPALLATPLVISTNATNSTGGVTNSTLATNSRRSRAGVLSARADCRTIQVVSGDSCASLASKCGISGADFTKYNPDSSLCSSLQPLQHVCCSSGTLPDFTPKPNPDGSCATYTVQSGDSCSAMAAANSLKIDQLESFNKKTWGWNGCSNIWVGTIICLSTGTPPMPAPLANALCGPQVPGTTPPPAGTDISTLNPCPLNACCDVWGQCGTTAEFCTDTGTGAPGTAKPGTNGCISNCGTSIVRGDPPAVFRTVAYFEGYGLGRPCLYQEAMQIDASKYTHLHFAFGTITPDYQVQTGDMLSTYEFQNFKRLQGPARILSFGGWDFSTNPSTYTIFRQGVKAANRLTLATNIANFIKDNDLDGVDIDWEYPGAPDIPGIPPADPDDGANYLAFLVILKNLLPGKSVSIAAPSSYWYLKPFPIAQISKVVDYIIFMTYDLHGQWDASNQFSQPGCPSGMCLRSGVNLTETINSLVMITKAGVPSNKVVVGVTSYGRSYAMADPNCHTEECLFTGSAADSNAEKGRCTGTAGYISDAEIKEIMNDPSRVNLAYIDGTSNTNVLVYDNAQWVGWMSAGVRTQRTSTYKGLNMGGTTNWASDLEDYNDPPPRSSSWSSFILNVKANLDPYQVGSRNGNWTSLTCTDRSVEDLRNLTSSQRWNMMDCPDAWTDVLDVWRKYDKDKGLLGFTASISDTIHGPESADCGSLLDTNNCQTTLQCNPSFEGSGSGPAGYEIWNSLVIVHEIYSSYVHALYQAAAATIDNSLKDFENNFAPVPPPPDDSWLGVLLGLVTFGATAIAAPFFNSFLAKMPYFIESEATFNTLKDTTYASITASTALAAALASGGKVGTWTEQKQDAFSNYLGQVIGAWANVTTQALADLFDGSDDSIDTLTTLISDGKMIPGGVDGSRADPPSSTPKQTETDLEANIAKVFFAYAIPAIWSVSGVYPFIVDSGYACGTVDPLGDYLSKDTMHATAGCYDNKLYYLATPKGDSQTCTSGGCTGCTTTCSDSLFSAPPGLDSLDGHDFGGIKVADLISGSVRTYIQNGNQNGATVTDPTNGGSFDDLVNLDVTRPGFIRIPVCSPDMAYKAWDQAGGPQTSRPNYPCIIPQINDCGDSTFVDQTSDASPPVDDCMTIVKNIKDTQGEWEVENAIGSQHQLVQYGECKFGVQGKGKNGNIDFNIGAEDIVDIITESVKRFGSSGRVGAKGEMSCRGTVKGQDVEWGLY